jgi:hypothetical protein
MAYELLTYVDSDLPEVYRTMSSEELDRRIQEAKEKLGKDLVILGHHYQRDDVIKFADFRGDSLKPNTSCSAASISWRKRPTRSPKKDRRSFYRICERDVQWPIWLTSKKWKKHGTF